MGNGVFLEEFNATFFRNSPGVPIPGPRLGVALFPFFVPATTGACLGLPSFKHLLWKLGEVRLPFRITTAYTGQP